MSKFVVLAAVGRDRVGIVARVAELFYELGCNLLDSSMTLLRGEFAIILMVKLSDEHSVEQLRAKIPALEKELGMSIHVRELNEDELEESAVEGHPHIISVYGADKPGIVAGVTHELAKLGANITDVQTKYSGSSSRSAQQPVFMMILEVDVPPSLTTEQLDKALKQSCNSLGMNITVQALEVLEL